MHESTLEELMLGMASQLAEKEDTVLCSDVRDKLFGPNEFSRRDLGALNIMRGRDNGVPDYNTVSIERKLSCWHLDWFTLVWVNNLLCTVYSKRRIVTKLSKSFQFFIPVIAS